MKVLALLLAALAGGAHAQEVQEVGGVSGILYDGLFYRTLDGTGPNAAYNEGVSGHESCQTGAIAIPDGYELMPDDADLVTNVIAGYCWGTHVLHTAVNPYGGSCYPSHQGVAWNSGLIPTCTSSGCSASSCSLRVLIRCSAQSTPPCAAGTAGSPGSCTDCAAGRHQPSAEQETCIACATGRYQNAAGSSASACIACGAGSYRGSEAGTAANQCITW